MDYEKIVYGAYKKLKYMIFYDASLMMYKKKLSEFETTNKEQKLQKIVESINSDNFDFEYFASLCEKISYIPIIKKIENDVIELNYFIDMPIELHIIDTIFTVLLGLSYDADFVEKNLYGNELDRFNLYKNDSKSINTIKWETSNLFKKYVKGYNLWVNKAVKTIKDNKIINDEITLITSDISGYYYSISSPFEIINKLNVNLNNNDLFNNILQIIKHIQMTYHQSLITVSSKKMSPGQIPIGMLSSMVIANMYLYELDAYLYNDPKVLYYGRYVDDFIIIYNYDLVGEDFVSTFNNFTNDKSNLSNIEININKTDEFHCNNYNYMDVIERITSHIIDMQNYYGNEDNEELSFRRYFDFEKKELKSSLLQNATLKEEDILDIDLRELILFMNYIFDFIKFKNTTKEDVYNKIINYLKENVKFNLWKEIYRWLHIHSSKKDIASIREYIRKTIDIRCKSKLNDVKLGNEEQIYKKIKNIYFELNEVSYILGGNINDTELYKTLIEAGMIKKDSIVKYLITKYRNGEKEFRNDTNFYLKYYSDNHLPFVHLWEILLYDQMTNILKKKRKSVNESIATFVKINNLSEFNYIDYKELSIISEYFGNVYQINENGYKKNNNFIISHPNIELDYIRGKESKILFEKHNIPGVNESRVFFRNILFSKESQTDLLILPELYVKLEWLYNLGYEAHYSQFNVVFGLENLVLGRKFFNLVGGFYPFKDIKGHRNLFLTLREKNIYSYDEKQWCKYKHLTCRDKLQPRYNLIRTKGINFSDYLCFEITDILSRALFKGMVDIISVPMLNRDTDYFNNITKSLSRDLSCCVVTSNSASWGNSSIILPKKSFSKTLTEFKGGFNSYLVSSDVPIRQLIDFNQNFDWKKYFDIPEIGRLFKPHSANYKINH